MAVHGNRPFLQRYQRLLVAASLAMTLPACRLAEKPATEFNPHGSAQSAERMLRAMNPVGMGLDDARRNMERAGFQCQSISNTVEGYRASLFCKLSTETAKPELATPPSPTSWAVVLDSRDGRTLSKLSVNRQPTDLVP